MFSLHSLQQPNIIKNIAKKELNMKNIELKNIKKLSVNDKDTDETNQ